MWEIIGYVLLGLLAVVLLLLIAPIYARITFRGELQVCVRVLGIPVFRFRSDRETPPKPPAHKPKTKQVKTEEKPSLLQSFTARLKEDGIGATLAFLKELAGLAAGTVRRIIAAVTVDKLGLSLYVAGEDAAQTAETTGKICAVLYPTVTVLQQTLLRIRKRAITVTPDFLAASGKVEADVTLHIVPIRVVWIAVCALVRFLSITQRQKEVSQNGKQSAESDGSVDR